jgi:hypothetical protein
MEITTAVPGTVKAWFNPVAGGLQLPLGPWTTEPNKLQWVDAATRLPCLIVRNWVGNLCGYAGVYPGHPLHGKRHYDVGLIVPPDRNVNYSAGCAPGEDESQGICHIPEPDTAEDVWDLVPAWERLGEICDAKYRDVAYAADGVMLLAVQLSMMDSEVSA